MILPVPLRESLKRLLGERGLKTYLRVRKAVLNFYTIFAFKIVRASRNKRLALLKTTYTGEGFLTVHNADFIRQSRFRKSIERGIELLPEHLQKSQSTGGLWQAHFCCWAANQAIHLDGDFVECGVWYGFLSRTIAEYVEFEKHDRNFYLVDAFGNLNTPGLSHYDRDIYAIVKKRFSKFPNVHLVRGMVPHILSDVPSTKIAYLSIDMNGVEPERAVINYFYEKMVPGGIIYLDDYGWVGYEQQKRMFDEFFADKPEQIFQLPSGQGVVVKLPPSPGQSPADTKSMT